MSSTKIVAPINKLNEIVESQKFIGDQIDFDILNFTGFFVLKNAFSKDIVDFYVSSYFDNLSQIERTPYHLTNATFSKEHPLNKIASEPEFIKLASAFFDGNVGCDGVQIFKKDRIDTKPVFMHQDVSYMSGNFERYSFFISLTENNEQNGSLEAYPGTHHFGYLGDAGEINESVLPTDYPKVITNTKPGDIFIMHSAVWHGSAENKSLKDRVYLEIKIQDANDPTTQNVICGKRSSEWLNLSPHDEIFSNSRTQRLKRLYQQLENSALEKG